MDAKGIRGENVPAGYSNTAWIFTQFTWWTNIAITILQLIRLSLRNKTIKNEFLAKHFFSVNWYFYWISYIFLVGLLFFIGMGYLAFTHDFREEGAQDANTLDGFIRMARIIITIFVHLVNPLAYATLFIWMLRKGFLVVNIHNKKEFAIQSIKIWVTGITYPLVYMIFYIVFARFEADPYPITDFQDNWFHWWVIPIVLVFFSATFLLVSCLVFWKSKRINAVQKQYLDV